MNLKKETKRKMTSHSIATSNYSFTDPIKQFDYDPDHKFALYCYTDCVDDSPLPVKNTRGVIIRKETLEGEPVGTDTIVMDSLTYTREYVPDELQNSLTMDKTNMRFFVALEGTLLRVFNSRTENKEGESTLANVVSKWFLSTHRKLDAFRSRWASKESFGSLFESTIKSMTGFTLEEFYDRLNPEYQYIFLLLNNNDNKIVCNPPSEPTILHVGTFIDGKFITPSTITKETSSEIENALSCNSRLNDIPGCTELHFTSVEEIEVYVRNCDWTKMQGVIAFKDKFNFRVVHPEYKRLSELRGREKSIMYKYLQVRMNDKDVKDLYTLYPDFVPRFKEYEKTLFEVARYIYNSYVNRYIKKIYTRVPPDHFTVMVAAHEWHSESRETNKISLEKIIKFMNEQSAQNLNMMIKNTLKEKKEELQRDPRLYSPNPERIVDPSKTPTYADIAAANLVL